MQKFLYLLIALLLLPALLINLGEVVFIDDEGIRALVAQEMKWTGNYIAPTLHGDAYLNKPPLWNWILALSFTLWGEASEWSARFPTIIALLGFATTTFLFSRRFFGNNLAFIHALTVITCGRMLFWDSMLALIDVCFSWVVYTQIMVLYVYAKDGKWWQAFGWGYLLAAIGFMLKGLPAIAFTGITIITLLLWFKSFKQFFRPAHLLSGIGCLAILAVYYAAYSTQMDLNLVAQRLFNESGKRTAVNHGLWETVQHVFAFPFEMAYHFMPWTLLLIFFLQFGSWRKLKTNDFAAFLLVVFATNLPLYWLSPNVYPRYLLMLFPLLFGSGLYLWREHAQANTRSFRFFSGIIYTLMSIAAVVMFFIPLIPKTAIIAYRWPIAVGSGLLGLLLVSMVFDRFGKFWKSETSQEQSYGLKEQRLLAFCGFLLLTRVVFNIFVLPPRAVDDLRGEALRTSAYQLAETAKKNNWDLAVLGYTQMEPATSFYLEQAMGQIVPRQFAAFDAETVYIVSPWQYPEVEGNPVDSLYMRHQKLHYKTLLLWSPEQTTTPPPEELSDGMGSGIMLIE